MNSFLCVALLAVVASAQYPFPSRVYSGQYAYPFPSQRFASPVEANSWNTGVSSWANVVKHGAPYNVAEWPSIYSAPAHYAAEVKPKLFKSAAPIVARSDSSEWKVDPTSWTDASVVPSSAWSSAGYYSAGIPTTVGVEKQVAPKKVVAPVAKVDQVQPVADPTPKLISYSTEISHDVPAKKEASVASSPIATPTQVAPVPKVVSPSLQYSAWSGESKPVEVKPASWASDVKPVGWTSDVSVASSPVVSPTQVAPVPKVVSPSLQYSAWSGESKPVEVKPASWASEVKPVGWTSEVKPASWAWSEPNPATWSYAPEAKPASWSSWSEAKPWASYVSPVQPGFYGASWGQPIVSTNAHHAISAPWSSTWSTGHPIAIQKRSERKPF